MIKFGFGNAIVGVVTAINWVLQAGFWDDTKHWQDNKLWND